MDDIKENKQKSRRGIAISILIFAGFMDLIDSTIVNVALPSIQRNIGAALGVAIVGVVFFHLIGTNFSQASLQHGFVVSAWTAIIAYGILALSSLFLPKRADVAAHLAEENLV